MDLCSHRPLKVKVVANDSGAPITCCGATSLLLLRFSGSQRSEPSYVLPVEPFPTQSDAPHTLGRIPSSEKSVNSVTYRVIFAICCGEF